MIANHMSLILPMWTAGLLPTQCFATFATQIVKLAADVGQVKETAAIGKRCVYTFCGRM